MATFWTCKHYYLNRFRCTARIVSVTPTVLFNPMLAIALILPISGPPLLSIFPREINVEKSNSGFKVYIPFTFKTKKCETRKNHISVEEKLKFCSVQTFSFLHRLFRLLTCQKFTSFHSNNNLEFLFLLVALRH